MNTSFESGRGRKGLSLLLAMCLVLSLIVPVVSAASRDFTGAVTNRDGSVLEARLPVLAAGAGSAEYVPANGDCVLQLRVGADGKVPVYYTNGLLVGIPVGTKVSDGLLKAPDGKTLSYSPDNGVLSTGTVVTVSSGESYTLVTYGDINGDSVLDALDATMIQRYVHHHRTGASAAQLEAALIDDDDETEVMDFSMFVNLSVSNEEFLKNQKKPLALCTASTPADGVATGSAYCPAMTVSEDGVALSAGDYTLSYSGNTAAGTGTVTATAAESSEYVGELSKSFTIYSLDGVGYPDTLLANTGAAQSASLSGLTDTLASFMTGGVLYNGSATAPSAAGVYRVGAKFTNSDGTSVTKSLGSMIIAPKGTTTYNVTVDNAAKTVSVGIKNGYAADTDLANAYKAWATTAESASVSNAAVTSDTIVSKLQGRSTFGKYVDTAADSKYKMSIESLSNVLGCFLTTDDALWANNDAVVSHVVKLNGVDVTVKSFQDADELQLTRDKFLMTQAAAERGQRASANCSKYGRCYASRESEGMESFRFSITQSTILLLGVGGTGLKTLVLGDTHMKDMIKVRVSTSTTFSQSPINLYDSSNYKYYSYSSDDFISSSSVLNTILKGMNISTVSAVTLLSSLNGKKGYMDYFNVSYENGLRYNSLVHLQFANKAATADDNRTLTLGTATNGTFKAYNAYSPGNYTAGTMSFSHAETMARDEVIRVDATPNSGYVLDAIKIVDGSGNVLSTGNTATGVIKMPAANGTLQVTFKPAS